jgi:hypothetical protein
MLRRIVLICLLLLGHVAVASAQDGGDLLSRVNALRASLGLPAYRVNAALTAAAQNQAQWMAASGSISHQHPDGSGPRTRAVAAGYPSTDVSENIYGGTNATIDSAWTFWVNSPIHYNGMTNARYQEIGIGAASGSDLSTFVLVFGGPGGPAPGAPRAGGSAPGEGVNAPLAPPSYVVGLDAVGNIMHEVQPGDTLGDIALIYGYTWDDIPYMKQINNLGDNRSLEIGSVFLVPPHDGTYTPTPGGAPDVTATPESDTVAQAASPTPAPTSTLPPTPVGIATAAAMPEVIALAVPTTPAPTPDSSGTPAVVAALDIVPGAAASSGGTITRSSSVSPVLLAALALQVGLLIAAGIELNRRWRRRR